MLCFRNIRSTRPHRSLRLWLGCLNISRARSHIRQTDGSRSWCWRATNLDQQKNQLCHCRQIIVCKNAYLDKSTQCLEKERQAVQALEDDDKGSSIDPTNDSFNQNPLHTAGIGPNFTLVDTPQEALLFAKDLEHIPRFEPDLFCDLEGFHLCRYGTPSTFQVKIDSLGHTWILDIAVLADLAFVTARPKSRSFRQVLETRRLSKCFRTAEMTGCCVRSSWHTNEGRSRSFYHGDLCPTERPMVQKEPRQMP